MYNVHNTLPPDLLIGFGTDVVLANFNCSYIVEFEQCNLLLYLPLCVADIESLSFTCKSQKANITRNLQLPHKLLHWCPTFTQCTFTLNSITNFEAALYFIIIQPSFRLLRDGLMMLRQHLQLALGALPKSTRTRTFWLNLFCWSKGHCIFALEEWSLSTGSPQGCGWWVYLRAVNECDHSNDVTWALPHTPTQEEF